MNRLIALGTLFLILLGVNASIIHKEEQISNGQVVLLQLVPVDPRSLMQGDYMALRFSINNKIFKKLRSESGNNWKRYLPEVDDGFIVVSLNKDKVATFKAIYEGQTLSNGEVKMRYRIRKSKIKFATNAFFFEEGTAKVYEQSRYGEFRVDEKGDLLLVAMRDKNLTRLGEPERL